MSSLNSTNVCPHVHALVCLLVFPLHAVDDSGEPLIHLQAVHFDHVKEVTALLFLEHIWR